MGQGLGRRRAGYLGEKALESVLRTATEFVDFSPDFVAFVMRGQGKSSSACPALAAFIARADPWTGPWEWPPEAVGHGWLC